MRIDRVEMEELFGTATYRRGRQYFADGRVSGLSVTLEGASIRRLMADVEGSGRQTYRTIVSVDPLNIWSIRTICSCPVGSMCKHAVAVLLAASGEQGSGDAGYPQNLADELFLNWLAALDRAAQNTRKPSAESVRYVLEPSRHQPGLVHLGCYKARTLKSGKPGKAKRVQPWTRHDLEPNPPAYLREEDMEVIGRVRGLPLSFTDSPELSGFSGAKVLAAALATGRLFWGSAEGPPLVTGDAADVQLSWVSTGPDQWRPDTTGLPDGSELILTDPPWYIDPHTHTAGPIVSDLPSSLFELVVHAPTVSTAVLTRNLPAVQSTLSKLGMPLPEGFKEPQEIRCQPTPVLQLYTMPGPEAGQALKVARLRFDYDGTLLPPHDDDTNNPTPLQTGDRTYLVYRDMERESLSEKALKDFLFLFELNPLWAAGLPDESDLDYTLPAERQWLDFLARSLPLLAEAGWRIEMDDSFDVPVIEASDWYGRTEPADEEGWFDVSFGVEQDGRRIDLIPLLQHSLDYLGEELSLDQDGNLTLPEFLWLHDNEQLVRVPGERVLPMVEALLGLYQGSGSFTGRLRLSELDAASLLASTGSQATDSIWEGSERLRELSRGLADFSGLEPVPCPSGLQATLRHYQQDGLNWLQFLRRFGLGGILADDMGLGKTVQTLASILADKDAGRLTCPALVVCPTSVIPNWKAEARRFAPDLSVRVLHGPGRHRSFDGLAQCDLVITSYPLLNRDIELHRNLRYASVFFDEGQYLKNPRTTVAKAARALPADCRFVLSGTPMENHLGELWSLFDLVLPGYLGREPEFRARYRNPIEKSGSNEHFALITRRIRPFMLRRTKDQVTPELPQKTEMVRLVELNRTQQDLYETVRASMNQKIRELMASKGVARSQIEILEALLKLRQICCHPALITSNNKPTKSSKLDYLMEIVPELLEEGRRILIFSQFTSMLALIEEALHGAGVDTLKLTGQTRDRETPVARFQAGEIPVFLISLKAGGAGLNLTAADCVIHYDPWWNPAVEQQATDRAWRIGQDKPVFVYRLICEGTVEERIQSLQQRKADLASGIYGQPERFSAALTAEDVEALFEPAG